MINGAGPRRSQDIVKTAYNDWVELLNHAGAADMLKDPYNVWLEAFHVATLFERHGIMHALQTELQLITPEEHDGAVTLTVEAVKQIQMRMLRQVMDLIASKGLSRA